MTPFKSLHTLVSLYCVVSWMIHSCVFLFSDSCSWVPCLSWTVKLLLFFRKILQVPQMFWFSSIFVYLNPFQQWLNDFEIHLFTLRTTEGLPCFPEDKISLKFTLIFKFKKFSPPLALNACSFLLEHQWAFEPSVIVAYESLSVKRWISKSFSHCWKGFKYTKMLENQRICGTWRIFLKNSRQFNCSGQTRDSWTTITKQKKHSCGSFR